MLLLTVQESNCHVWVSLDLEKTAIAAELLLQDTEEHLARREAWGPCKLPFVHLVGGCVVTQPQTEAGRIHLEFFTTMVGLCPVDRSPCRFYIL